MKDRYFELYLQLFAMVEAGTWHLPEADEVRRQMERAKGRPEEKAAWGMEVGWPLYQQARYGEAG